MRRGAKWRDMTRREVMSGICALVGGVYTVAGIVDSIVYHSAVAWRKQRLGKLS